MLKIRRSRDRLIFNMGIPMPGKDGLYIEPGPGFIWIDLLIWYSCVSPSNDRSVKSPSWCFVCSPRRRIDELRRAWKKKDSLF